MLPSWRSRCLVFGFPTYRGSGTIVLHKDLGCYQEEVTRMELYLHSQMPVEDRHVAKQKTSIYQKATHLLQAI